ncbi:unnamed protein product [Durusdinium trenchii]|uniref:FHA domain-containing protein n=3 Tax=Durusdinium trenchii TaxID=1381693 RepID=A0ABP0NJR8_9DINO
MVSVVIKQEERCQLVVCRHGQDQASGQKFVLKPGDSVRFGRSARGNEVVLDYEGVSKHHAEITLREKLPEEVILGSDVKLPTMLSIRDLNSKNGIGIRKTPFEQESVPTIGSFERMQAATSQVVEDGFCIMIPAKSRHGDKQMSVEQRIITFYVSTVMIDVGMPGWLKALKEHWIMVQVQDSLKTAAELGQLAVCTKREDLEAMGLVHGHGHIGHGAPRVGRVEHYGDHGEAQEECEDVGSVCFEPTGKSTVQTWKWVGDGRGAYEKVENFAFVGQGAGSFERRLETQYPPTGGRFCPRWCFGACCCGLLAGFLIFLIIMFTRRQQADPLLECTKEIAMMDLWSETKKAFCCAHTGRYGCPPQPPPVPEQRPLPRPLPRPPPPVPSTPPGPDCLSGSISSWSKGKAAFCCKHVGRGCPLPVSMPYNCHAQQIETWAIGKKLWCCQNYQVGCPHYAPTLPYDCEAGASNWKKGWSSSKQAWCCSHNHVACMPSVPVVTPSSMPYDCHAGYSNWRTGWSEPKKGWCCDHFKRGCSDDPYDCDAGLSNWHVEWSEGKKFWCCEHRSKGCEAASSPYDCSSGYSSWQSTWTPGKKTWCCEKQHRGCQPHHWIHKPLFDCQVGYSQWSEAWTPAKKTWCCTHRKLGCAPAENYDCNAGFTNWRAGWSDDKKSWCCEHAQKGCSKMPYDCNAEYAKWKEGWSTAKKAWCCQHFQRGCGSGSSSYDCKAGLSNWRVGWSADKKSWCCTHAGTGCISHQHHVVYMHVPSHEVYAGHPLPWRAGHDYTTVHTFHPLKHAAPHTASTGAHGVHGSTGVQTAVHLPTIGAP